MNKNTTYMVVETRNAYAVVLDSRGRFIKAANLGYKTGDVTDHIVPLIYPRNKKEQRNTIIRIAASLAACVCLCIFGIYEYQYMFVKYGDVHIQINPEIEISLSRSGRVLDVEGENPDGEALLKDYKYKGKSKETVVDELTELAIEQKYLTEGGQITVSVNAGNSSWASRIENELLDELNRYLRKQGTTVEVSIGSPGTYREEKEQNVLEESQSVTIPIPQTTGNGKKDDTNDSTKIEPSDSGYSDDRNDGITNHAEPSSSNPPAAPAAPSIPAGNNSQYGVNGSSSYGDTDDSESDSSDSPYSESSNYSGDNDSSSPYNE